MNKKVLIVEDEPDIREAIVEAVEEIGYDVQQAENGEVGLTTALEWKPDLILLDLVMPVMDGHETLKRLRQDSWGKTAKVIVLTSMDKPTDVVNAHGSNIQDYVIKAHNSLDEIVAKVRLNILT